LVLPPALLAVIVLVTDVQTTPVGVPLITPEEGLIDSPAGKVGFTDQFVTVPVTVGVRLLIGVPTVPLIVEGV
jgi:hypothetical protein